MANFIKPDTIEALLAQSQHKSDLIPVFTQSSQEACQKTISRFIGEHLSDQDVILCRSNLDLEKALSKRLKKNQLDHPNMSLEKMLQAFINQAENCSTHTILLIENAEALPITVLHALIHLHAQQAYLKHRFIDIILSGTAALIKKIQPIDEKNQNHYPFAEKLDGIKQHQNSIMKKFDDGSITVIKQHKVKMISWFLLAILVYVIWQTQHLPKPQHHAQPLLPSIQSTSDYLNPQPTKSPEKSVTAVTKKPPTLKTVDVQKTQPITDTKTATALKSDPLKTHFALQWSNSHNLIATQALQKQLNLANSKIIQVMQDKTMHFILVSGNYSSIQQAKDALAALPTDYHHQQPWIRPIANTE